MAKSGQEVVYEGWLTKSPPTKRIWRAKWRRRWFSLTQSGELPGQYILTYYADRNCRKLKGVIDLDHCEQVDLGLKLEERKLKFDHVFDIKTPSRTYFLAADSDSDMHSWVKNICRVCGLKLTEEEDYYPTTGVEIIEENCEEIKADLNLGETPPISPVSTSPYIPISECITGKSPIYDPKDYKTLLEYNIKNSMNQSTSGDLHPNNDLYDQNSQRNYINFEVKDPRFYDCPRKLVGPKDVSPMRSPTDSESVFTDDDWVHNTSSELNSSKNTRPSDSSADVDLVATQKYTKVLTMAAPPRPPKRLGPSSGASYLNLTPKLGRDSEENDFKDKLPKDNQGALLTDETYDFPRSHVAQSDDALRNSLMRRHCYNNAAPVPCIEGTVFRYDISPKPGSSTKQIFRYDDEDEPASPHSQNSSTAGYSNLPSPALTDNQLMPPPIVNRDLKPKRKLSDSHSVNSNPEPASPRSAPSVDRKLKPVTPSLQDGHRKYDDDTINRKIRAAPSPTPPLNLGRSHESLLHNETDTFYHKLAGKMQYLDLDLDGATAATFPTTNTKTTADNVYKEIDFVKTRAFNVTRNNLEKERQEK